MALVIEDLDISSAWLSDIKMQRETITFAGAGTLAPGVILGRITASGKLIPCNLAAVDGSAVPKAVVVNPITATGAGDVSAHVAVGGTFRRASLVFANGDPVTVAVLDALRDYGIFNSIVTDYSKLDNA